MEFRLATRQSSILEHVFLILKMLLFGLKILMASLKKNSKSGMPSKHCSAENNKSKICTSFLSLGCAELVAEVAESVVAAGRGASRTPSPPKQEEAATDPNQRSSPTTNGDFFRGGVSSTSRRPFLDCINTEFSK